MNDPESYKDVPSNEWFQFFTEIIDKTQKVLDENKKLENDIERRQKRYVDRERNNRKKIDELQEDLKIRMV